MKMIDVLKDLVLELDRVHPDGQVDVPKLDHRAFPNYRVADNGQERHFTLAAQRSLLVLTDILFRANPQLSRAVRSEEYAAMVKQAIADCHAAGQFDLSKHTIEACRNCLKDRVRTSVENLHTTFTHYFPAWTLGVENSQRFAIGPVQFLTRDQWIAAASLHRSATVPRKGRSMDWKKKLRMLLEGKARKSKHSDVSDWLYRAIKDCSSILKVKVKGCEQELSRQLARYACKTALDSVALLFNHDEGEHHRQFVLGDERLIPVRGTQLVETKGKLWLPGSSFRPRGWMGNQTDATAIAKSRRVKKFLAACGRIIKALLDPSKSSHPKLAQRWATALSVYAEGCREVQDALAVAKLGSSLDILSGGGMERGILDMLLHQTGKPETQIIVKLPQPLTFKQVVERIYKVGRSQFLHGNHVDPMMRFTVERQHATYLARAALRASALRLTAYTGPDDDKAFQTM